MCLQASKGDLNSKQKKEGMDEMNLCATGIAKAIKNGKIVVNEVENIFKRKYFFLSFQRQSLKMFSNTKDAIFIIGRYLLTLT